MKLNIYFGNLIKIRSPRLVIFFCLAAVPKLICFCDNGFLKSNTTSDAKSVIRDTITIAKRMNNRNSMFIVDLWRRRRWIRITSHSYTEINDFFFISLLSLDKGLGLWCLTPLSSIFQLYRGVRLINICYRWFILQEYISQTNITSKANHDVLNAMRNPFRGKAYQRWQDDIIITSH